MRFREPHATGTNGFVSTLAPLPSGLPLMSLAVSFHRRLALDSQHELFLSDDDGQHWKPVPTPWAGHAIAVAMVPTVVSRPVAISAGKSSRFIGVAGAKQSTQSFAPISPQPSAPAPTGPAPTGSSGNTSSSLSGAVTDAAGAVIPGADVVLRDSRSSIVSAGKTDAYGRYLFAYVAPGSYKIEAAAPGFGKLSLGEQVAASQHAIANLTLAIGQASETVSVTAVNSQIEIQPQATTAEPAHGASRVARAAKGAAATAPAMQTPTIFFVVTDTGDRWTSADGLNWQREPGGR